MALLKRITHTTVERARKSIHFNAVPRAALPVTKIIWARLAAVRNNRPSSDLNGGDFTANRNARQLVAFANAARLGCANIAFVKPMPRL